MESSLAKKETVLTEIVERVRLMEGLDGVKRFLLQLYLHPGLPGREMSRAVGIPVPVVTAVKNELKQRKLLATLNGMRLTPEGTDFTEEVLSMRGLDLPLYHRLMDPSQNAFSLLEPELDLLKQIYDQRPAADVTIDQSKCTPETGMKRAILLLRNGCLFGGSAVCIGDDDFISAALCLLNRRLFGGSCGGGFSVTVLDMDRRVLDGLSETARKHHFPIEGIEHDLRFPLPARLEGRFGCVLTDPPYTPEGLSLFVSRGIFCLKKQANLPLFLSFIRKPPQTMFRIQQELTRAGLLLADIFHAFNEYDGAQVLGGVSDLFRLLTTEETQETIAGPYEGKLYTGEQNPTLRIYRCLSCKKEIRVGTGHPHPTIEALKEASCPHCGQNAFQLLRTQRAGQIQNKKG